MAITPRASDLVGIDAIEPLDGGGTSGFVPVSLRIPLAARFGGTEATNLNTGRHNLFSFGTGGALNAVGDTYYRSSATVVNRRAIGAEGYVMTVVSGVPDWRPSSGGPGGGVEEAPKTGQYFVRKDEAWSEIIDDGVY